MTKIQLDGERKISELIDVNNQISRKSIKNVNDYVYHTIRDMILTLKFVPGEKLSEVKVANMLQTSKTPIREAFIKLSVESLIEIFPQRGTRVSLICFESIKETRFIRKSTEAEVLRCVMKDYRDQTIQVCEAVLEEHQKIDHMDHEQQFHYDALFHTEIYNVLGLSRAFDMIGRINADYQRVRYLTLVHLGKAMNIFDDHYAIYKAIKTDDIDEAIKASNTHLDRLVKEEEILSNHFASYFLAQ